MADADDFGTELESLILDTDQPQARSSAADYPVDEPIDPVFQADAWGQYTREQGLAMQQAQTRKPAGGYPQWPQQDTRPHPWQQPAFYGAVPAGQQGHLGPVGQPSAQQQAYV